MNAIVEIFDDCRWIFSLEGAGLLQLYFNGICVANYFLVESRFMSRHPEWDHVFKEKMGISETLDFITAVFGISREQVLVHAHPHSYNFLSATIALK